MSTMNHHGADWCEENIDFLASQIEENTRFHPQWRTQILRLLTFRDSRRRWIRRQIERAIEQARKATKNKLQQ